MIRCRLESGQFKVDRATDATSNYLVVVIGGAVSVFGLSIGGCQAVGCANLNQIGKRSINRGEANLLTFLNQYLVELLG